MRQAALDPKVAPAGTVEAGAQLGVDHGGAETDNGIQAEGDDESRPGHAGGGPGEDEDAGADHGPDADHGDIQELHLPAETDFGVPLRHVRLPRKGSDGGGRRDGSPPR